MDHEVREVEELHLEKRHVLTLVRGCDDDIILDGIGGHYLFRRGGADWGASEALALLDALAAQYVSVDLLSIFRERGGAFGPLEVFLLLEQLVGAGVPVDLDFSPYRWNLLEKGAWMVSINCENIVLAGYHWTTVPVTLCLHGKSKDVAHFVANLRVPIPDTK